MASLHAAAGAQQGRFRQEPALADPPGFRNQCDTAGRLHHTAARPNSNANRSPGNCNPITHDLISHLGADAKLHPAARANRNAGSDG